jgi:hypothetical protein
MYILIRQWRGGDIMEKRQNQGNKENNKEKSKKASTEFAKEICPKNKNEKK